MPRRLSADPDLHHERGLREEGHFYFYFLLLCQSLQAMEVKFDTLDNRLGHVKVHRHGHP